MIRVISGDNELAALDFQKHYRMPAVYLMDPDRSFERQYNRNGWPFLMLVDEDGDILYQCNNLVENDKTFMKQLQNITKTNRPTEIQPVGDIPYRKATLQHNGELESRRRSERFTSIACADDTVYTVYTAVEDGNSHVYLRIQQPGRDPNTLAVAATDADEYDGTVLVDANGLAWVCWTGNRRGNTYNIYLNSLDGIRKQSEPILISQSKEDAMHGRMAVDASNTIWVTYYRWEKMNDTSRDKEVYARRYAKGSVSEEIHVSPDDVPTYEDHTDPVIAVLDGRPMVCWSWDFHKPDGYTKDAQSPTIFARAMDGHRAAQKAFHLSEKRIDMTPVLGVCGDTLWCAWDSLGRSEKSLCVRQLASTAAAGSIRTLVDHVVNVCSPSFAFYGTAQGVLTWSQTSNGMEWSLWKADYDAAKKQWGHPVNILSDGNPRFGSCAYDAQGRLWVACSVQTDNGREVRVQAYGNGTDH